MTNTIPDYDSAVDFLCRLQKVGIKFGLNRTENLLQRLGNPHLRFRSIHIAGTNGKGSTAAMISSILKSHGFRVGLYTSPHLVRFTERFRINDREAPADRIFQVFQELMAVMTGDEWPTFFEAVTAMAFHYFAQEKVDWAVVETGMGGRLDATNVIYPEVAVITNVAMDHQEFLGPGLSAIAREKAGIIKDATPVVTAARQPVVQSTLKTTCLKKERPFSATVSISGRAETARNGSTITACPTIGLTFLWDFSENTNTPTPPQPWPPSKSSKPKARSF